MPITAMATVAPGDTITSAGWNVITGNISLLDGRTGGDPGAAGKWPVSSGTLGASWVVRATAVIAALLEAPGGITEPMLDIINSASDGQFLQWVAASSRFQWNFIQAASIVPEAITEPKLDMTNSPTDRQVVVYDTATSRMFWDFIRAANIFAEAVTEPKLDMLNGPSDNQMVVYQTASSRMFWDFVRAVNIATDAVETAKIKDLNVTGPKLSATAVEDSLGYAVGSVNDSYYAPASGALTCSTTLTLVPGVTVTVTNAGTYIVQAAVKFSSQPAEGIPSIQVYVNGSAVGTLEQGTQPDGTIGGSGVAIVAYRGSVGAGQVVQLRAKKASGAGTTVTVGGWITAVRATS